MFILADVRPRRQQLARSHGVLCPASSAASRHLLPAARRAGPGLQRDGLHERDPRAPLTEPRRPSEDRRRHPQELLVRMRLSHFLFLFFVVSFMSL